MGRTRCLPRLKPVGFRAVSAVKTADGEYIPYEFVGSRLTDEDGAVTSLAGVGRDLTERRRRERRFQAFVAESRDIISVVDVDGVFQYQSPLVEHISVTESEQGGARFDFTVVEVVES